MSGETAIGLIAALVGAVWVGIGAAAPEIIWQGMKIALAEPTWADLVSALMIGLILAFFIEPLMERVRDLVSQNARPSAYDGELNRALFTIGMSFLFAVVSVALHDAMLAIIAGKGHLAEGTGIGSAIKLAAEWAIVPFLITLAWQSVDSVHLAVPMGVLGAVSPFVGGWLFGWPLATVITTTVPCLAILGAGYAEMRREPTDRAFIRCARRMAVIAIVWLPIALAVGWIVDGDGQFYGVIDFLVDFRFYAGWIVGLVLVPWPAARVRRTSP